MDPEGIVTNAVSQIEKDKYYMVSFACRIKNKTHLIEADQICG